MELLRGNPHLTAKPELAAVGKARGRIDIYRRAVDKGGKGFLRRLVLGYYCLAVRCGMARYMLRRGAHIVDNADSHDIIEKFRIKIILICRSTITVSLLKGNTLPAMKEATNMPV